MERDSASGQTRTGAEALVEQLEAYGVEYVFGTCGHTNIALPGRLRAQQHRVRHRPARAGRRARRRRLRPRVRQARRRCCVHVGPGMMNAVTGVATAALDSVPLVDHHRRRAVLLPRTPPAPGGQPPRRRRPDGDLPAVRQAGLARAPGRGPAAVHRAGLLDRDLRTARRGAAQRPDGHLLAAAAAGRCTSPRWPSQASGPASTGGDADRIAAAARRSRAPADLHRWRAAPRRRADGADRRWPSTSTSRSPTR